MDHSSPADRSAFAPTRWTLVLRTRGETPESRRALSELCEIYYEPVLGYLRREGRDDDAARELAQEFFLAILQGAGVSGADQSRGRFRSYLLGALKHFLAGQRAKAGRLKRGGAASHASLDVPVGEDEGAWELADPKAPPPDALFDRAWACVLMSRALAALEQELKSKGRLPHFSRLKPWLVGELPSESQAAVARDLQMSESAVKVAVHRMRQRFGQILREEIAQTLRDPAQVEEELQHLRAALG